MNRLEKKLKDLDPNLFSSLQETKNEVKLLLDQYIKNFPEYTDHSIHHTQEVFNIVDDVLNDDEISNLNSDEIYVLSMSSYLHDIGMCIPEEKIKDIADTDDLLKQKSYIRRLKRKLLERYTSYLK
ncbi:HD domain-containing protein [Chryseobacterium indoltheticum]|uniref:HD domain-containing protein n=1 Tax=Chryseobacterium indoltheticum TaxID=254 RepID=UPI003F491149